MNTITRARSLSRLQGSLIAGIILLAAEGLLLCAGFSWLSLASLTGAAAVGALGSWLVGGWVAKMRLKFRPADSDREHDAERELASLAGALGIKTPRLFVQDAQNGGAFSFEGPTSSFVVVDRGLLEKAKPDELRGVLGHEAAHIACNHGVLTALFTGATVLLLCAIYFVTRQQTDSMIWGLLAALVAMRISDLPRQFLARSKERAADTIGALCAGDQSLASYLTVWEFRKIAQSIRTGIPDVTQAEWTSLLADKQFLKEVFDGPYAGQTSLAGRAKRLWWRLNSGYPSLSERLAGIYSLRGDA